ncbi:MAG: hypothetical protein ACRYGG_23960, partial [Janthinobacterium lividum]
FIVGSPRWFPDFIFTAPRSGQLTLLRYSWLSDQIPTNSGFVSGWRLEPVRPTDRVVAPTTPFWTDFGQDDFPQIQWSRLQERGLRQTDSSVETVEAMIAVLEGEYGVFLDRSENSSVLVVDLQETDDHERVRRVKVRDIRAGSYVVLRTNGEGDYVPAIADTLLGTRANVLRELQKSWKLRLRFTIARTSVAEVSRRLKDLGSTRANDMNIRNWSSWRNIKTHDPLDFRAVMKLIELEPQTDALWNAMVTINQAHIAAGQKVRRMLLHRMQHADLNRLKRDGRLEIRLPDVEDVTLSVFRVVDMKPASAAIPISAINTVFLLEPDLSPASR